MNRSQSSSQSSYLWAIGDGVAAQSPTDLVQDRYRVVAPQIWLDTQPTQPPPLADPLPASAEPYLKADSLRLHVPGLHGVIPRTVASPIVLLNNSPIHRQSGQLYPALMERWPQAERRQQLQWLWQLQELEQQLVSLDLAASLLDLEQVRVEGWRIRLRQLQAGAASPAQLQAAWQPLATASPQLASLVAGLTDGEAAQRAQTQEQLNQQLLAQIARQRVRIRVAGATDTGPDLPRNEDACYPEGTGQDTPPLAVVCDGVGGHASGDVASRLAVQSLQLQLQGLLSAAREEEQVVPPPVIIQQIEAVIRIVNDVICHQNDLKGLAERQRMGTTLVMAVVVPQRVQTETGWHSVEELYIAHVGDSRAYWLTPDYCHLLTVDDDIVGREVAAGRQLRQVAAARSDAAALTQALGTRSSDSLKPHIQRFLPLETGVLLLCSDGLSDNHRVEQAWANYIGLIVKGIVSLEAAVASWIELANQKNGHDNTSVVLMFHQVRPKATEEQSLAPVDLGLETELAATSEALLYGEESPAAAPATPAPAGPPRWAWLLAALVVGAGIAAWWLVGRQPDPRPDSPDPTLIEPET